MHIFHTYYRFIYFLILLFTIVLFPIFGFTVFIFFEPRTDYQLSFEGYFLSFFVVFILCIAISRFIYNLRHEKAPKSALQVLWVLAVSIILAFAIVYGYTQTKQYFTAAQDDLPVETVSKLVKVVPIHENYYGPIDQAMYGQIPFDAKGKTDRYTIKLIDSHDQVYQTAYFFYKQDFQTTLNHLKEKIGKGIVINMLPHSKRIVSIEDPKDFGPIYENNFLLSKDEEEE